MGYLDNGRVLGVGARRFGRLAHSQVLDVAASEDDVLKDVLARWDGPIGGPVLSAKGTDWWWGLGGGGIENVNVLQVLPFIAATFITFIPFHLPNQQRRQTLWFRHHVVSCRAGEKGCARSDVTVRARH